MDPVLLAQLALSARASVYGAAVAAVTNERLQAAGTLMLPGNQLV